MNVIYITILAGVPSQYKSEVDSDVKLHMVNQRTTTNKKTKKQIQ